MKKNVTDWNIDCRGDNEKNRQNRRRGSGYPAGKRAAALLVSGILFCAAVLTGCSGSGSGGNEGTDAGDKEITVAINSETGTLDPAGSIALTYLAYSVSALDELLTFDENGEIEYRAADSYEVNEDSTEWTFHLREDALWSDGTPVTSGDFLNTITRALDPASGSGYANYLFPIENAEAIYNGEAEMDTLGVEAPDDHTLIFHLEEPCVYFLDLLRLPVYTPSCEQYADSPDSGWDTDPETSLANGPFYLTEYVPDQYFVLEKNENYWDRDNIHLDRITYRFFDDTQSMANAYETGEVDVATSLPSTVMELYEGQDDLLVTDLIATRYIYFNLNVEPLDDVRVREAINLAIDREELCQIVGADTEPTYNLIAKYMKDKETGEYFVDEAEQPFEGNVERARELLAEAGYPDGEGFPTLTYSYPTLEMDSDTAQVLQSQLKENLNINIELNAQELQSNYSSRYAGDFELIRMNWTADFADPYTYLSMLLSNSTYNCSGINDPEYDALVEQSNSEADPGKRAELMHQAEKLAVGEQFYIIPLYAMKSVNLVNPEITGIRQIPASGALEYRYADI
ncbi:peptide ABC transporter substrate-binding protein [Mediterraneibacter glycyrrhizinilyticus]|uniref:peptide ABC transporter substrate-binding protein n=1 Tax=Mediterraneibacter glycyrrhizinilyticus TaxID=342942 RepID=UPI001960486B|nr:peptide ABC transporter substrate-binding protein [Mediterraneibacter glycyrrhizinilyticus]MBM6749938.1 peptide ABC transporter substrate-binding protein [Mediterraneibacter glycyrrhizinilyticus]